MKINEIARTSTFAWNSNNLPLLATGTIAGTLDVNFSSSVTLELWDIFSPSETLIFSAAVENRFYALAWSKPFEGRPQGLLAGAFENGVIEFWDADILIKTKDIAQASVHRSQKHTGPVKSLQFNPIQNHVLVSGGSHGQIFVWDTKTFGEPIAPGQAMSPMDEVTCVAWNNSVSNILASTGNGGYTSIWDLKHKKELLHLSYTGPNGKANFSHVAWHPTISTKLITASDNDSCPLLLTWDLRNANEPEQILEGHKKGVLSLDWCKQDPELLISSGKDNTTILWNPIKGIKLGEYPTSSNWAFETRFAPVAPDIFATASFDGKLVIQSIQDTSPPVVSKATANEDDFWNDLSTVDIHQPVFEIKQAPKWLKKTSSGTFGFGSKLVTLKIGSDGKSVVSIEKFISAGQENSNKLFDDLRADNYSSIIAAKLAGEAVNPHDRSDWEVLSKLAHNRRESLFSREIESHPVIEKDTQENLLDLGTEENGGAEVNGDDFFAHLGNGPVAARNDSVFVPSGGFKIHSKDESESNKKLISLILANKIEEAVSACLDQNRLVEASILAMDASENVKEKVRGAYFRSKGDDSICRIIYNASSKNVTDLVAYADVENWKEIAVAISSFCTKNSDEYNNKMTELGNRILNSGSGESQRDDAILCFLAGNALDKIAHIWLKELPEYETELLLSGTSGVTSPSDARLQAVTNFVEKIATYRHLTGATGEITGPMVEPVAKVVLEFTNLVAGSGEFELANKFLQILPSEFAGTEKERISKATSTIATVPHKVEPANNFDPSRSRAVNSGAYAPAVSSGYPAPSVYGQPAAQAYPQPAYNQQPSYPPSYAQGVRQPSVPAVNPHVNPYARAGNPYVPPPTASTAMPLSPLSTAVGVNLPPPPPKSAAFKNETEGWNDLPDTFKPKSNLGRAAAAATPSPVHNQPAAAPALAPAARRSVSTQSLAPPPRVSRAASSKVVPSATFSPKPPHVFSNRYAPPPGTELASPASVTNGFGGPSPGASSPMKKNPYAPAEESNPAKISYAVPPPAATRLSSAPVVPMNPPPKNPYAPAQQLSPQVQPTGIMPPPPKVGAMMPTPPQHFGASTPPVQPAFNSAPPPPRQQAAPVAPPPQRQPAAVAPPPQRQPSAVAPPPQRQPVATLPPPPPPAQPQHIATPPPPQRQPQAAPPPPPPQHQPQAAPPPPQHQPQAPPPPPQQPQAAPAPPPQPQAVPPTIAPTSVANNAVQNIQEPQAAPEPSQPEKVQYPPGDRSHIPEGSLPVYETLNKVHEAIKPHIPAKYARHANDMESRLNMLFDVLNNDGLSAGAIESLKQVSSALEAKDFGTAMALNVEIATNHGNEIGNWHVGLKRLLTMAEAMY
ncbi:Protein transport protein SEC31 [Spathaspora sp. JA1]|nr:Protein transport protein SEC31 [Spathaspora sp. JA1]